MCLCVRVSGGSSDGDGLLTMSDLNRLHSMHDGYASPPALLATMPAVPPLYPIVRSTVAESVQRGRVNAFSDTIAASLRETGGNCNFALVVRTKPRSLLNKGTRTWLLRLRCS